ncbi:MAG: DUF3592 domain-containing protein [Candidatus Sulfotelmatobacter sp.]
MWFGLIVLVALSGLCTLFALVVTAAQAWQEHAQESWPQVTARVDRCAMDRTSTRRREMYYIHCRLSYALAAEQNVADVASASAPSSKVWQYPPNQIQPFEDWLDAHPPGTPIIVRYDPANHTNVVLAENYMPRGGPHTPSNIKLLALFGGSFLVLSGIARITRPRPLGTQPSAPL